MILRRWFSAAKNVVEIDDFYRKVYLIGDQLTFSKSLTQVADQIIGQTASPEIDRIHVGFIDNPLMKESIFDLLQKKYQILQYFQQLAKAYGDGWMPIVDGRSISMFARTPEPDDIMAMILVRDGSIVPGSIQRMPTHRLLTVNGLFRLPTDLEKEFFKKT